MCGQHVGWGYDAVRADRGGVRPFFLGLRLEVFASGPVHAGDDDGSVGSESSQ